MPFTEGSMEALVLTASVHLTLIGWAALSAGRTGERRSDESIFFH